MVTRLPPFALGDRTRLPHSDMTVVIGTLSSEQIRENEPVSR